MGAAEGREFVAEYLAPTGTVFHGMSPFSMRGVGMGGGVEARSRGGGFALAAWSRRSHADCEGFGEVATLPPRDAESVKWVFG